MESEPRERPFGMLGVHLLQEAREVIKQMHEKLLLDKSSVRRSLGDASLARRRQLKKTFENHAMKALVGIHEQMVTSYKRELLDLKERLLVEALDAVKKRIQDLISDQPCSYLAYLHASLESVTKSIPVEEEKTVTVLERDVNVFSSDPNLATLIDKLTIQMQPGLEPEDLGGFVLQRDVDSTLRDHRISNIIDCKLDGIEVTFSAGLDDSAFKRVEADFSRFIVKRRESIYSVFSNDDGTVKENGSR